MEKKFKSNLISYFNLVRSFFDWSQVSYLIVYVTNRCNFKCNFCFYRREIAKGQKADELSLEEFSRISQKVGPLIQLSLTGGEPFLREDLAKITGLFVKNNFVKYITIPTNASLTSRIVDYLANVLPQYPDTYFRIPFSIDGIEKVHDEYRSAPGAYKKIQDSYEAVSPLRKKYHNLVIDSNTVFSSASQDSILETIKTVHDNFDFDNISITYIRGDMEDCALKKTSFRKYLEANSYLENLARKKEKRFFYPLWRAVRDLSRGYLKETVLNNKFITSCTAGKKILVISETGEVYPCEILKQSMGNIRDFSFDLKKVIADIENQKLISWIKDSRCKCTFECALAANVLWGKFSYFSLLRLVFKNCGKFKS